MASLEDDTGAKAAGEEDVEYESDSEEGTSALALRRRVASDDEDDDEETNNERSDGYYAEALEGGPPVEDEDEEEEEDEEEADEEGEEYEDVEDEGGIGDRMKDVNERYGDEDGGDEGGSHFRQDARKAQGGVGTTMGICKEGMSEEKKDAEPFVVPTAGSFYMHDDRFRYNGIARPRRSAGGRKLWEAKDEKPWVHDRFEELRLDESYPGQGVRGWRGRGRQGRAQGRGKDARARGRGHREKVFDEPHRPSRRGLGRGRGLRRAKMDDYEFRESRSASQRVVSSLSHETDSLPASTPTQKPFPTRPVFKPLEVASKKPTISSMLNISSPPFFPTGTISQSMQGFVASTSKGSEEKSAERDTAQVRRLVNTSRSGIEKEMTGFSSTSVTRLSSNLGVNNSLAAVSNNGDVEAGPHRSLGRGSSTPQQQLSRTGSGSIAQQQRVVRAEVTAQHVIDQPLLSSAPQPSSRGAPPATQSLRVQSISVAPQQSGKGTSPATQSMRVPQPHQLQAVSQGQTSSGQAVQSQAVVSPVSFPAKPAVELKAAPSSLGSNLGAGAIGRGTQAATMPGGRGTLIYGSSSLTNGLRSVVQFAGQPQGGLGVPTVGVALPGYSSQPQFSFPNSEVTWIPILAGGGSLNSNYNPPYIAVDGGSSSVYYTQQPSQASAFPPTGRDLNGSKTAASNSFKLPSRTEPDDLGQQRRRYSQMTFGEERR